MSTLNSQAPVTVIETVVDLASTTKKAKPVVKTVLALLKKNKNAGEMPVAFVDKKVVLFNEKSNLNGFVPNAGEIFELRLLEREKSFVVLEVVSQVSSDTLVRLQQDSLLVGMNGVILSGEFITKNGSEFFAKVHGAEFSLLKGEKTPARGHVYAHTDRRVRFCKVTKPWEFESTKGILATLPKQYQEVENVRQHIAEFLAVNAPHIWEKFVENSQKAKKAAQHTAPAVEVEVATTDVAEPKVASAQQTVEVAPATETVVKVETVNVESVNLTLTEEEIKTLLRVYSQENGVEKKPAQKKEPFHGQTKAGRKSHLPKRVEGSLQPDGYSRKGRRQGKDSL